MSAPITRLRGAAAATKPRRTSRTLVPFSLAVLLSLPAPAAGDEPRAFESAPAAAHFLVDACRAHDGRALRGLVSGKYADDVLETGDPARNRRLTAFADAADQRLVLREDGPDHVTMMVGFDAYPFPIPIVRSERGWSFDADEGMEELIDRTVGWNELTTISVLRDYVTAQAEYASEPRDGTPVRRFAAHFLSTPGTHDGLYWDTDGEAGEEPSPFGPLVEARGSAEAGSPYYGYHYRILTGQGPHAPGGAYSYVIHGNLVAGFAAVAWPAHYGRSGVMTFLVNHYGVVYQKDLGEGTEAAASAITSYDPDETWTEADTGRE